MGTLQKSPLHDWHIECGARMSPFAGFEMPLSYGGGGFITEYRAVRERAGLFDISHMGVLGVSGADAEKFIQHVSTNDASRLRTGDVQYTLICNDSGGILDDVTVYKASDAHFFCIVNTSNVQKILRWFLCVKSSVQFDVTITETKDRVIFALQGPSAEEIISGVIPHFFLPHARYSFTTTMMHGWPVVVSRTGYTGEDGFEVICPRGLAEALWKKLFDAGKKFKLLPCGLEARDMLRTEAGMRLYGSDISENTNPIEAGLEKFVVLSKPDFIGKPFIERALALKNRGGGRYFHGLIMPANCFPERGCLIFCGEEVAIPDEFGIVTSATFSPLLKKRILLCYLREKKRPGDIVWIKDRKEKYLPAEVTSLPFYSKKK